MNANALARRIRTELLQQTFDELRRTDAESVKAWEWLIDARRDAPWTALRPRPAEYDAPPVWRGEDTRGYITVWTADCGYGDMFMLAPYVRELAARPPKGLDGVRVVVPPSMEQWAQRGLFGAVRVETKWRPSDLSPRLHCSMMDLPGVLYMGANFARDAVARDDVRFVPRWRRLGACHGVVSSLDCSKTFHDQGKRVPYGLRAEVLATLDAAAGTAIEMHEDPEGPNAFKIAAERLATSLACVTTDTALAHLANAVGCPSLVMLHEKPNWRWGNFAGTMVTPSPWSYKQWVLPWQGSWQRNAKAAARWVAEHVQRSEGARKLGAL